MLKRLAVVACILFFLSPVVAADALRKKPSLRPAMEWTVDDVVNAETAADFRISPDGRRVVYVKTVADDDKGERVGQLFRASLTEKKELQLTRGATPATNRAGRPTASISLSSAPARAEKDREQGQGRGAESPNLAAGHLRRRAVAADGTDASGRVLRVGRPGRSRLRRQRAPTLRENTTKDEHKDDSTVVDDEKNEPPVRLFKVEVASKKVTRLTDNSDRITALSVSPDGKYAVTVHSRSLTYGYDNKVKPIIMLNDLIRGKRRQVFKNPKLNIEAVRWTPDGKGFYASSLFTTHPRYVQATITQLATMTPPATRCAR